MGGTLELLAACGQAPRVRRALLLALTEVLGQAETRKPGQKL
jgi:hypothetical protein